MRTKLVHLATLCVIILAGISTAQGQGIWVPSAGPINSAMAGASTAAPVDFGGSYWNPAILSGLDSQEFLLGSALASAEHPSPERASGRLDRRNLSADRPIRRIAE